MGERRLQDAPQNVVEGGAAVGSDRSESTRPLGGVGGEGRGRRKKRGGGGEGRIRCWKIPSWLSPRPTTLHLGASVSISRLLRERGEVI